MDDDDFLREEATKYRQLAEQSNDDFIKKELREPALVCEGVARGPSEGFQTEQSPIAGARSTPWRN